MSAAHRALRMIGGGFALILSTGCYSYTPSFTSPIPGSDVAVVLTDRGRVALNDRIGAGIDELRGTLVSRSDTSVIISMHESVTLRGDTNKWTDELVTVTRDQFGGFRLRTFSRGKSGVVAGAAGAAVAFFVINGGFDIGGRKVQTDPTFPPGGPGPSSKLGSLLIPFRSDF
jgi:hypothetical protein